MRRIYIFGGLVFILLACAGVARWADGKGWISHKLQIDVAYGAQWRSGEERDCNSELDGANLMLACAIYPGEILHSQSWSVAFHGYVGVKEKNWMCHHDETSIFCVPSEEGSR